MQTTDNIIETYENVYQKVYNRVDFEMKRSERNLKFIENFIKLLDKEIGLDSIGENFIFDYTVFQFNYYEEKKTRKDIQVNWVYGKKAFERWQKKGESYGYFNSLLINRYDIEKPINDFDFDKEIYKDRERNRFYNTEVGNSYCLMINLNTNPKSKLCRFCKYKKVCY